MVRVCGEQTSPVLVTRYVRQGPVLASLLLFIVIINDLLKVHDFFPLLCADGDQFVAIEIFRQSFENDLSRVKKWSNKNHLPSNVTECSHLSMSNSSKKFCFSGKMILKCYSEQFGY